MERRPSALCKYSNQYIRPIPEHHRHAAIRAHRHRVHHRAPKPLIELCHRLLLLLKRPDEPRPLKGLASRRSLSPLADRSAMASVASSNRVLAFSYRSTKPL